MMKIYLATNNSHKIAEMRSILEGACLPVSVIAPGDLMPEVEETGETLEENALLKAAALKERIEAEAWAVADDTGLLVDALDGAPGVYSARYAGRNCTFAENNRKLLGALESFSGAHRGAQFATCIVAVGPCNQTVILNGICRGRIIREHRGNQGFGYDPIFQPDGFDITFAEMSSEVKNKISHRGRALQQLVNWLAEKMG